jgi:hypothetical protein
VSIIGSVSPALTGSSFAALKSWRGRRWVIAVGAALGVAAVVGMPTGLIPTPYYTRMTATLWWNYPVWVLSSVLAGITLATYYRPRALVPGRRTGLTAGGLLTAFAVGCPSCNSLVVAAVGTSGALSIWAPLQPLVAVIALGLMLYAARRRLRAENYCVIAPRITTPTIG